MLDITPDELGALIPDALVRVNDSRVTVTPIPGSSSDELVLIKRRFSNGFIVYYRSGGEFYPMGSYEGTFEPYDPLLVAVISEDGWINTTNRRCIPIDLVSDTMDTVYPSYDLNFPISYRHLHAALVESPICTDDPGSLPKNVLRDLNHIVEMDLSETSLGIRSCLLDNPQNGIAVALVYGDDSKQFFFTSPDGVTTSALVEAEDPNHDWLYCPYPFPCSVLTHDNL